MITITFGGQDPSRYFITCDVAKNVIGRQWDNISEAIKVIIPDEQVTSTCTMFLTYKGRFIDSVVVSSSPIDIKNNVSQYPWIDISFMFTRADGYVKNSEIKRFYFDEALKPEPFVPEDPTVLDDITQLISSAFVEAKFEDGALKIYSMGGVLQFSAELIPSMLVASAIQQTVSAEKIDLNVTFKNLRTLAQVVETFRFNLASTTNAGLMSPTDVQNLTELLSKIDNKLNKLLSTDSGYFPVIDSNGQLEASQIMPADVGYSLVVSMNSSTYVLTIALKNKAGTTISTQTVDLPIESMVVSASYDSTTKELVLTLQSGDTLRIDVSDLVVGLVPDTRTVNGHALSADVTITKADIGLGNVENLPVSGKADKVSGATNGDLAGLDANGNLTDSGIKASDVATQQDIEDSKGSRLYSGGVFEEEIDLGSITVGTSANFSQNDDTQVPTSLAVKLFVESKLSGHVYRATIDIKANSDEHYIFDVIVGTIPTIDGINALLVNVPRGEYRAYNENTSSYEWLEVDSIGAVLINGVAQSSNAEDWSIGVVQYI